MSNKEIKKINPLTDDQVEKIAGGCEEKLDYWIIDGCSHPDKMSANQYKEEPFFVFWTKKVRKRHCNVCNMDIWLEV